jgi:hypothetical protein
MSSVRRKFTQRFKGTGLHDVSVTLHKDTKELVIDYKDTGFKVEEPIRFTQLDGVTPIEGENAEVVGEDKDHKIMFVRITVEPNKDCGFYIHYTKAE